MKLTELKRCKRGLVTRISKYNHECRMHGVRVGSVVDMVYHYHDKVVVIVHFRDTVTIPKSIAKYITVEAIK